jgi:hypothetical protein
MCTQAHIGLSGEYSTVHDRVEFANARSDMSIRSWGNAGWI